MQEDERAARRDFRSVIVAWREGRVLVADDLRVVVHMHRNRKIVVRIEDDGHAFFGNRVDLFFGHVVVFAFGGLFDRADFGDGCGVFAGRSVEDGRFGGIDVDAGIVHAERPQGRYDMFDGRYAVAARFDGGAARGVDHIVAQRGDDRLAFEIRATEYDTRIGIGWPDGHVDLCSRVQSFAGKRDGRADRLLVGSRHDSISNSLISVGCGRAVRGDWRRRPDFISRKDRKNRQKKLFLLKFATEYDGKSAG